MDTENTGTTEVTEVTEPIESIDIRPSVSSEYWRYEYTLTKADKQPISEEDIDRLDKLFIAVFERMGLQVSGITYPINEDGTSL